MMRLVAGLVARFITTPHTLPPHHFQCLKHNTGHTRFFQTTTCVQQKKKEMVEEVWQEEEDGDEYEYAALKELEEEEEEEEEEEGEEERKEAAELAERKKNESPEETKEREEKEEEEKKERLKQRRKEQRMRIKQNTWDAPIVNKKVFSSYRLQRKELPPFPSEDDVFHEGEYITFKGVNYEIPKITPHMHQKQMFKLIEKRKKKEAMEHSVKAEKTTPSPYSGEERLCASIIVAKYPSLTPLKEKWQVEYEEFVRRNETDIARPAYLWQDFRQILLDSVSSKDKPKDKDSQATSGKKEKQQKKKEKKAVTKEETVVKEDQPSTTTEKPKVELIDPTIIRFLRQEREWLLFWENYQPAPRETEADRTNDRKSLDRACHRNLYLIVKNRGDNTWQFPEGAWKHGETMRGTAERQLQKKCGYHMDTFFFSNAPCGYYQYTLPEKDQEKHEAELCKVFFYRARYLDGPVQLNRKAGLIDYLWVTGGELKEYFSPEYYNRIKPLLNEDIYLEELNDD